MWFNPITVTTAPAALLLLLAIVLPQAGSHPYSIHQQKLENSTSPSNEPIPENTVVTSILQPSTGESMIGTHPRSGRTKREPSSVTTMMRMPGTNWCGKGWRAKKYHQLGTHAAADACCRQHDLSCNQYISAGETVDGLHNRTPYTAMHCSCDERFATCLQMANTDFADTVGHIFFNVLRTQCYHHVVKDVCVEHSWWGRCNKTERRRVAEWRETIPYSNNHRHAY